MTPTMKFSFPEIRKMTGEGVSGEIKSSFSQSVTETLSVLGIVLSLECRDDGTKQALHS